MKMQMFTVTALTLALLSSANASEMTREAYLQQREVLNPNPVTEPRVLRTPYRVDATRHGHSTAAAKALSVVSDGTRRATRIAASDWHDTGTPHHAGAGHSDSALRALRHAGQPRDSGDIGNGVASH